MSKRKEIDQVCTLFYSTYKMPDKMLFIQGVMDSCKTQEQLDATLIWGKKALYAFYDNMSKHVQESMSLSMFGQFRIDMDLLNRTAALEKELIKHHKILSKKISQ